jgi:thiazole synthase
MNHIDTKISAAQPFTLYGVELSSRLLLGTARYPSPQSMSDAVRAARVSLVTVSVRREQARGNTGARFFDLIKELGVRVLPNTAGCRTSCSARTGSSSR